MSRGRLRKTCPWHCSFFQPYRLREPSTALASNTHTGITSPNPRPRTPRTEGSPVLPGLRAMLLDSRRLRPNLRLLTSGGRDTRIPHRGQREMPATRSREYGGPGFALTTKQAVAHFHNVPDVRAEQGRRSGDPQPEHPHVRRPLPSILSPKPEVPPGQGAHGLTHGSPTKFSPV